MNTKKALGMGAAGLAAAGMMIGGASLASADAGTAPTTSASNDQSGTQRQDDGRTLSADAASRAIAAAAGKESGATVKGVHLDRDGSGYEVMLVRSDGTRVEAKVSDTFTVESVSEHTGRGPGGPGGGGRGGEDSERTGRGGPGSEHGQHGERGERGDRGAQDGSGRGQATPDDSDSSESAS